MSLILTVLLILLSTLWCVYRKSKLSVFSRNGIPNPPPSLIWGNMREYSKMGTIEFHKHLIRNHGPIVGYYLGTIPYLIIADHKLLHEVLVSNSKNFLTRPRRIPSGVNPDPKRKMMLAHLPPEIWQTVRKALAGMFNPAKLKPLIPRLRESVERRFMGVVEDKIRKGSDGEVELGSIFECLSVELIGQSAFGRKAVVLGNEGDPMLRAVRDKYEYAMLAPLNVLTLCFPELSGVIGPVRVAWQRVKEVLGVSAGRLNQTLWEVAMDCVEGSLDRRRDEYSQFMLLEKAGVSRELMVAYSVNAFQGDYENVSTTLCFLTQLLTEHPEVQDKIREEASRVRKQLNLDLNSKCDISPEVLYEYYSNLKYMECVIYEMLRLWPQTSFVRRSPAEDYEYVNDEGTRYVIPKGVHIQVCHHSVQRDKEVWGEDSEEFKPERFLDANVRDKVSPNCVTYQGFGSGMRHCLGQKFATLVLKMVVTNMVERYDVRRSERTGSTDDVHRGLMIPTDKFYAVVVERVVEVCEAG